MTIEKIGLTLNRKELCSLLKLTHMPAGGKELRLTVYNSQGVKVEEIKIPTGKETVTVNVQGWESGIYYLRMTASGKNLGSGKVIVKK